MKTFSGIVVSDKMKDTAVVAVSRLVAHPKYRKYMRRTSRIKAHDPGNTKKSGDAVTIAECHPISKEKHFRIV